MLRGFWRADRGGRVPPTVPGMVLAEVQLRPKTGPSPPAPIVDETKKPGRSRNSMEKSRRCLCGMTVALLSAVVLVSLPGPEADAQERGVVVIANPSVAETTLDQRTLVRIFLGRKRAWSNQDSIEVDSERRGGPRTVPQGLPGKNQQAVLQPLGETHLHRQGEGAAIVLQ